MQDGEVDRFADSLVGYRRVGSYAVIRPPVQERFFEISFVMAGWFYRVDRFPVGVTGVSMQKSGKRA